MTPHDPELVKINPQKLTPASARALHRLYAAWLISLIGIAIAFAFFAKQTSDHAACVARQTGWDNATAINEKLTAPLTIIGFSGDILRARITNNAQRAENHAAIEAVLGPRPC